MKISKDVIKKHEILLILLYWPFMTLWRLHFNYIDSFRWISIVARGSQGSQELQFYIYFRLTLFASLIKEWQIRCQQSVSFESYCFEKMLFALFNLVLTGISFDTIQTRGRLT